MNMMIKAKSYTKCLGKRPEKIDLTCKNAWYSTHERNEQKVETCPSD
jgi:hypothetical protein